MGLSFTPTRLNDLVVDVSLTSVAHGDILYRGASKWNNLAPGNSGDVLTSGGAGANPAWAAPTTAPFADSTSIVKGSVDATKLLRFEVDGFTTGTTRVLTPPDSNGTIAVLEVANVFSTNQTIPTLYGSASSGGNLTVGSTSHATKGKILFGTSGYDEVNNRLGIATASPASLLHVSGYNTTFYTGRFGDFVLQPYAANNGFIADNAYFNGSTYARINSGYAMAFQFYNGQLSVFGANTGSGTFTQSVAFKVLYTGGVGIGGSMSNTPGDYTGASVTVAPKSDAVTDAVTNIITIGHNSSGTPASSFGVGQLFTLQSSTTADQNAGQWVTDWEVATHASRSSRQRIYSVTNAAALAEVARFDGGGGATPTAGNTGLMLWDVDNATLERVTVGAADSGGTGYKVLRIPN